MSATCAELRDLLAPYADGELKDAREATIDQHVADCPSCAEEVAALKDLDRMAAEAFTAPPVSEPLWEEVWAGVRRETERRRGGRVGGWLAGLAAAAVVVLTVGLTLSYRFQPAPPHPPVAELRPGVVESVEVISAAYIAALDVGEGEVPALYLTEVN